MKMTKKSILKRFISAGITMVISAGVFATPAYAANELINEPYEYPVLPGTEEWFEMKTFPEKIEACKIPEAKAEAMSTEALVETILNHPLWPLYFCYEMDTVYDMYRDDLIVALSELETRNDADELLLETYEADQVAPMAVYDADTFETSSKSDYLEILLAQPVFYDDLSENQLTVLDETVAEKADIRRTNSEYTETSVFYSILDAQQNSTVSLMSTAATVYTPKGHSVSVVRNNYPASSPSETTAHKNKVSPYFAVTLKSGYPHNRNYNCHSYAWYSQLASNPYWMPDPSAYWEDGSYVKTTPAIGSVPANNLRGFFKTGSNKDTWHSVIVIGRYAGTLNPYSQNLNMSMVQSKWGEGPVYVHGLLDHPWCTNETRDGIDIPSCTNYSLTFYK